MATTTAKETRTFTLTLNGVAREVEATDVWGDGKAFDTAECVALGRVGRTGSSLWPTSVRFALQRNGEYRPILTFCRIRKQGVIVAWNDAKYTESVSRRNG